MTPIPASATSAAEVLSYANMPVLWACAIGVFAVIAVQTLIYIRAVRKVAPSVGMSGSDITTSLRAGAVSAIGPSLAVALIAIALISVFGTPAVLVRVGLVGSAAYESAAAGIGATTQGATLGGEGWDPTVFATTLMAMAIAGGMWMVATLVLTPLLKRGSATIGKRDAGMLAIIPTAALIGAFATLVLQQAAGGVMPAVVALTAALVMTGCMLLSRIRGMRWLQEWGLGIALVIALLAAVLIKPVLA